MKTILFILLQTILVGTVTDSETGEAIPNASVYYAGTHEGTTTNNEGAFYLRSAFERKRTLVVSAIGYRPERFAVEPNRTGGIEVALREQIAPLQEVTITPGVNPAFAIVDSVRKHKGDRQQATGDRQQATGGEKETVKLSLSNFTAKQLQRRLWKQFEPMMVDSLVTLYERIEEKGLRTEEKGVRIEEKAYILTATDYQALIPDNSQLDFYQNNVSIANKAFLSPLASAGKMYYHYYLVESTAASSREEEGRRIEEEGNQTLDTKHQTPIVRIDFKTKNPFYPTFNGSMWVDTVAWTITRLEADIPRNNAVNYLTGGRVKQNYVNGQLTDEYVATVMDFAIKQDSSHIWPSVLVEQRRQATGDRQQATGDRGQATGDRGQATGNRQQATGDSPPLPPSLRFASWLGQIIGTGYIPTGTAIDFGHVQEILQVNETEGVHVGIPLRTNERLWKNVSLEAAMGYGFKNRQFTGLGKVSFNLPTLRRNILSVEYRDHYVWQEVDDFTALMRENGVGYKTMDFTSYAFEALRSNKQAVNSMVRRRQFQIATENDWDEHVETQFYLRIGQIDGETLNRSQGELNDGMRNFFYAITGGIVRVGFGERKVDSYFRRVHVYSNYPVIYGGVECGSWAPYSSTPLLPYSHVYGKFTLMVRQTVNLGMGGELDYVAQVGTMVGQVPFTLLHHFEGNQGYAYDPYRFTLMNNLQYNAKHFCALHLSWNGQGVLFNLIPGVRYLRLRELVTFKLAANLQATGDWLQATGGLTGEAGLTAQRSYSAAVPYVEIGCGIGNILRVMDLHSVWRLTNREDTTTPRWALRFRIHLGL